MYLDTYTYQLKTETAASKDVPVQLCSTTSIKYIYANVQKEEISRIPQKSLREQTKVKSHSHTLL